MFLVYIRQLSYCQVCARENRKYDNSTPCSCMVWQRLVIRISILVLHTDHSVHQKVNQQWNCVFFMTAVGKSFCLRIAERHNCRKVHQDSGQLCFSNFVSFQLFAFENIIKANQLCSTVANIRYHKLWQAITCSSTHAVCLITSFCGQQYKGNTKWHFRIQINERRVLEEVKMHDRGQACHEGP